MLKSTYKPSANALPPGWTEHKAPTGHTYYYNAATKESTYKRPGAEPADPSASFMQHQAVPAINLSDPRVANAYMAQYNPAPAAGAAGGRGGFAGRGGGRGGGHHDRPRPQPADRPRSKAAIPGCEPWLLVYTKYGRRFAYNPVKNASYWRIPEKLKAGILELDKARIREKAGVDSKQDAEGGEQAAAAAAAAGKQAGEAPRPKAGGGRRGAPEPGDADYDSSEYEEVEVTDDEADGDGPGGDGGGPAAKRPRTEEPGGEAGEPVEFSEADIAFQLQAMGEDYGLEPGEYDDGRGDEWPEGAEGVALPDEDARALFQDLLDDHHVNPYSPWEKLVEEGKVFDDARYTVLPTTKARREAWEAWSRDRIRRLREERAREEKRDPRIPYLAFLQEKATPKLYWPEFRRKYRKEAPMRDPALPDRDRERWYREHVARLRLPGPALKADLTALLRSVPPSLLNRQTLPSHLPPQVLTDLRYISLGPEVRDPLVEAYIQTLPPPPEGGAAAAGADDDDEAAQRARDDRRRRERALRGRERAAEEEEERRRQRRRLEAGRAMLRENEEELERAMQVDKRGLQSQLAARPGEAGSPQ